MILSLFLVPLLAIWTGAQSDTTHRLTSTDATARAPNSEQIAVARARAQMLEYVLSTRLADDRPLREWAAQDLYRDRAIRLWVRQLPPHGRPRVYADGACEVDVLIEPDALRDKVQALIRDQGAQPAVTVEGVSTASARWERLWTTGSAHPDEAGQRKPTGWADVSSVNIELARRAAAADATRALMDVIATLEISPAVRVQDFLATGAEVRAAVRSAIAAKSNVDVRLEPDQVAVAEADIPVVDVIAILAQSGEEHDTGDRFRPEDFRQVVLSSGVAELRATGLAVPPQSSLAAVETLDLDAPAWAAKSVSAVGTYTPEAGDDFPPVMLSEFARLEGVIALEEQLTRLRLTADVGVGDFLAQHVELKDDVVLLLSSARAMATNWRDDGSVETRVELPLRRLWLILARAMQSVEVDFDGDEQPASRSG